jgi:ABC-2 type transport system permease protein
MSSTYAIVLGLYGDPDWAPIYGGYLALGLLACLLIALGMLMSSLTENQVVAATMALGLSLMLWFADAAAYVLPAPLALIVVNLSLIGHFTTFVSGSLFLSDAGYYITLSLLALFLTTRILTER